MAGKNQYFLVNSDAFLDSIILHCGDDAESARLRLQAHAEDKGVVLLVSVPKNSLATPKTSVKVGYSDLLWDRGGEGGGNCGGVNAKK